MNAIRKTVAITNTKTSVFLGHSDPKAEQAAALDGPYGQYHQFKEKFVTQSCKRPQ